MAKLKYFCVFYINNIAEKLLRRSNKYKLYFPFSFMGHFFFIFLISLIIFSLLTYIYLRLVAWVITNNNVYNTARCVYESFYKTFKNTPPPHKHLNPRVIFVSSVHICIYISVRIRIYTVYCTCTYTYGDDNDNMAHDQKPKGVFNIWFLFL